MARAEIEAEWRKGLMPDKIDRLRQTEKKLAAPPKSARLPAGADPREQGATQQKKVITFDPQLDSYEKRYA